MKDLFHLESSYTAVREKAQLPQTSQAVFSWLYNGLFLMLGEKKREILNPPIKGNIFLMKLDDVGKIVLKYDHSKSLTNKFHSLMSE